MVVAAMNKFTGMLSRIGIMLVVLYFAASFGNRQAWAVEPALATDVEYALPYPGMLPDSPFYFLKVLRDQAVAFLIKDPTQKSFYFLLLSDKRVGAGGVLVESGKISLGATTLLKAEDYFSLAVDQATVAKRSGKDASDLLAKLAVAGAKHAEVLSKVVPKTGEKESGDLAKAYRDNTESRKRIMELLLQK